MALARLAAPIIDNSIGALIPASRPPPLDPEFRYLLGLHC
jgi:hypothetical protein